ncbi:transcriptional regulator [Sulfuriferula plumbiphila]|uniref:Chemotaxis protein CheA n=1 Tax=Sulfuriferula plumbiphila TaxID=171865 RepID=A0A512L6N1_9PROT|nr:hybrid sensor histidine kinase/response regulator [Sulfuriferula plumbiphila]BBP04871.1 transcriptional regulator [Sulfuriferula plumbiphila]GEP30144.1 transcriptional regulator [Sulfuriferula plumbiphila]
MPKQNDEFLKRLLATFRIEADEHLQTMSSGLLELEKMPAGARRAEIIERVFREAHSLKGAARAVNLTQIESACQPLESVFAALKNNQLAASPPLLDLLHQTIDALGGLLVPQAGAPETRKPVIGRLIRQLDDALTGPLPAPAQPAAALPQVMPQVMPPASTPAAPNEAVETGDAPSPAPPHSLISETIRVSTAKLDGVMRQAEELLSPRLASGQRVRELSEAAALLAGWKKERTRIQSTLRLFESLCEQDGKDNDAAKGPQQMRRLLEYLDAEQRFIKTLEDRLAKLKKSAEHDQRTLTGMTDSLLHDVKEMQLLPFMSLLEILPRFVRELARAQGKDIELVIQGGEIEIDRRILEKMKDPLIHLLRNGIDHGIEKPALRREKQKPPHGTISVAISQQDSGKVEIRIADDGAGIDASKVKAAAGRLGIVSPEVAESLGAAEALALVFQSGISTSPLITDVSGRGLGLAIVREKVERLGGTVALKSSPGAGTEFRIVLPLTLANFQGVIVRAGGHLFIIPAISVERVVRVANQDIQTVENRETIALDGQVVALGWLSDVLEMPRKGTAGESAGTLQAVVLALGAQRIAFRVEEIVGEQEVLVKPLGPQLTRVRNVAGASILGTGQVVPVLNVSDLLKSAVKRATAPFAPAAEQQMETERQSILVVEDSITSRALLKNILESAGYRVTTAVDGVDAYTALKTGTFDLIVSDVEMPRMDGFDLTAKVRADKQFAELPVVLVTALGSREHRERGIDVGANAYIVKSSFDQSNLLEVISRLI